MKRFELGGDHAGQRLDKLIVSLVGVGRATARRLFDEGRVSLEVQRESGPRVRRAVKGDVARAGEVLLVDLEETSEAAVAEPGAPLLVRLERDDLLVVDKPANQATAPLRPGERGTLANALVGAYPELAGLGFHPREPGLCHRLDTGTSGLVLVGRTAASFAVLTQALRAGEIDKRWRLHREAAVDVDGAAREVVALEHELHGEPRCPRARRCGPPGRCSTRASRAFWFIPWVMGVSIMPGATAPTRTPKTPKLAGPRVRVGREGGLRRGVVGLTRGCRAARCSTC
jgi:hypothetical protein